MAEMEEIKSAVQDAGVGEAWIGLRNGSSPKWQWSLADRGFYTENETEFRNWDDGNPNPNPAGGEDCVAIKDRDGKKWHDNICTTKFHFICYNGRDSTHPYVLIEVEKNWRDAQRYCRENHTDLASVRNQTENTQIQNTINQTPNTTDNYVWIGLFRDAWEWSDGSSSSFRHWGPGEPNYGSSNQNEFCVEMKPSGLWNGVQCNSKRKCICYEALPSATVVVVSPQSAFYSGDAVTLKCNITQYTDWHQYVWRKDNSIVPGKTNQTITITLPQEAGQYQCSGQREGRPVKSSTSGPVTIKNNDKLVLVGENKTWMEALQYCREHHVDLVSVSSEQIQRWVEGWAKGASSPHVWLGLRYSCNLGFWSWVNGVTVYYDNWASDAEREQGCARSVGAVGREGGQWVSLSDTNKLNFICTNEPPRVIRTQIVRVELKVASHVDLDDPDVQAAFLQQMGQRLKDKGLPADAQLTWRKQPDGKVFHEKESGQAFQKKEDDEDEEK
ncbi:hypothetical protein ACEWY4_024631 [Coilia grayii]|uniref:Macrophage mannose receptor 1-like n=1 Tax=Coilia grayii TaxID=363190 RepID=A0ABD1IV97_9TELE